MPVGKGMFFDGSHFFNSTTMLSKEDLYEVVSERNKDLKCKCTNCLDSVSYTHLTLPTIYSV